jgi:hypothetical protein
MEETIKSPTGILGLKEFQAFSDLVNKHTYQLEQGIFVVQQASRLGALPAMCPSSFSHLRHAIHIVTT